MKKLLFISFAFFLAASGSVYAYDFGAAGITAAIGVTAATLALVFGAPAALGTVAIGALVAGITFAVPSPPAGTSGQIEVQLSPSAQLATPSGWTAPISGQTEPSPPATVPTNTVVQWSVQGLYTCDVTQPCFVDASTAAAYACSTLYSSSVSGFSQYDANTYSYTCAGGGGAPSRKVTSTNCPAGYSVSGDHCALTTPANAMKPSDGKCTIKRTVNSFAVDPRDPDCASGKIPASVGVSSNSVTLTNPDGSTKIVIINNDGSSTVSESRPNTSSNTTETNTTTISAPNGSGVSAVTGQGQGVAPGTGTQAGTSSAPVQFDKTGLATTSGQASQLTETQGIHSDTSAIKDALTNTSGADSSLSTEKTALDNAAAAHSAAISGLTTNALDSGGKISWLTGSIVPASCGCVPLTIDYHGHHASFDWCPYIDQVRDVMAWVLYVITAGSLFVVLVRD